MPARVTVSAWATVLALVTVLGSSTEAGASPPSNRDPGTFSDTATGELVPTPLAQTYHAVDGDETLQDVATRYNTTVEQLMWWNGMLDAARLSPGDRLYVGGSSAAASVVREADVLQTLHRVTSGDTLSEIAAYYEVDMARIVRANGLLNPNRLMLGQNLIIPDPKRLAEIGLPPTIAQDRERLALIPHFEAAAHEFDIDPEWLMSVAYVESGWNAEAESPTGAIGIGQLMPETAVFISNSLMSEWLDPWYAPDNIRMSARYLSFLLSQTNGDENTSLAAYYEGLGAVRRFGISSDAARYALGVQGWRPHFATIIRP